MTAVVDVTAVESAEPLPEAGRADSSTSPEASFKMSKGEYSNAVKSFMAMDVDGDGYLSLEEFRGSLGLLGIDDAFAQILFNSFAKADHHDRDGYINRSEFCASMAVMLHPAAVEEQVSMAFDAYDVNKDGKLTLEELDNVITAMFAAMVKMRIRQPDDSPSAAAAAVELFRQMDEEEKGWVTKEDYIRLATTNPELLKKVGLGNAKQARSTSRFRPSMMYTDAMPPRSTSGGSTLVPRKTHFESAIRPLSGTGSTSNMVIVYLPSASRLKLPT